MTLIFHIATRDAALLARQSGEYRAESLSSEGFIHFSGSHQVLWVAQRFYAGQHALVLLAVDPSRLRATLKYEGPVHLGAVSPENEDLTGDERLNNNSDTFPHLYGPLNFDAVVAIYDFDPDASGVFSLPAELISAL